MVGWMARDPGNKYTSNRQFDGTISVKSTSVKGSAFTVFCRFLSFRMEWKHESGTQKPVIIPIPVLKGRRYFLYLIMNFILHQNNKK